jgi:hypothetical protein
MRQIWLKMMVAVSMALCLMGCATQRPVLYPDARVEQVGEQAVQRDIDDCLQASKVMGQGANKALQTAGSAAIGAATGAAIGAATGAVVGRAGQGAAMGAAGGGTAGLLRGLFQTQEMDPVQKNYVEECLREKGYKVLGWR